MLIFFTKNVVSLQQGTREKSNEKIEDKVLDASISNFGLKADIALNAGPVRINPYISFAMPKIAGVQSLSVDDKIETETTVGKEAASHFVIGTEASLHISKYDIHSGFTLASESYQYTTKTKTDTRDTTIKTDLIKDTHFGIFTGASLKVNQNIKIGLLYDIGYGKVKSIDEVDKTLFDESGELSHNINLGLERVGKGFWIFDEFSARTALNFGLSTPFTKTVTEKQTIETSGATESDGFTFNTGIGVRRGIGSLDLAVVLGTWEGSFLGPQAASATFTVDFARKGNSTASHAGHNHDEDEESKSTASSVDDEFDL